MIYLQVHMQFMHLKSHLLSHLKLLQALLLNLQMLYFQLPLSLKSQVASSIGKVALVLLIQQSLIPKIVLTFEFSRWWQMKWANQSCLAQ